MGYGFVPPAAGSGPLSGLNSSLFTSLMEVANNGCINYIQLITPGYYLHLTKI